MVREQDLEPLYAHNVDLAARGPYYTIDVPSLSTMRLDFAAHGFWEDEAGTLLVVDEDDALLGVLLFFRRVTYPHWDSYELAYRLFDHGTHGKGVMTEALGLMVDYLFATHPVNRLEVVIAPENVASIRVAEKCGFQHEGRARGAFRLRGVARDVEVMARLRDDPPVQRATT